MSERKAIRRALISVYDKSRLAEIGRALSENGVEIISTGSTCKSLRENGIKTTEVSEYTGFPEIMDGRVKTLHPKVHGAILGRPDLAGDADRHASLEGKIASGGRINAYAALRMTIFFFVKETHVPFYLLFYTVHSGRNLHKNFTTTINR